MMDEWWWALLGLGAFTPLPGVMIGGILTETSGMSPMLAAFGFATAYSLVVLSPGLFWLRTRNPTWLVLLVSLWGASAISWIFWLFYAVARNASSL
jgi:hypothetical protein